MAAQEKQTRRKTRVSWFLYILQCNDGSFYTGITKDLERRLKMHNEGKGARFTRTRRPVCVIHREVFPSRTKALIREWTVKRLSRKAKEVLVGFPSSPDSIPA